MTSRMRGVVAGTLLAVCDAGAACSRGGDSTPAATTFQSDTYGYSIELPADWSGIAASETLGEGEPPATGRPATDIFARAPARKVSDMQLPALVVGAQSVPAGTVIADWEATVIGVVGEMKGCPAPESAQPAAIGGYEALVLRYPDCPEGGGLYHLWAIVVQGGRGYHFVWFDESAREMADRPTFDALLASVRFG
jgi:hypothetical protein